MILNVLIIISLFFGSKGYASDKVDETEEQEDELEMSEEESLEEDKYLDEEEPSIEKLEDDNYLIDNHGIGLSLRKLSYGLFYDYNLPDTSNQVHIYAKRVSTEMHNMAKMRVITMKKETVALGLRKINTYGFYYGLAFELSLHELDFDAFYYPDSDSFTFQTLSVGLLGDFGWQGRDGYYFQIGYMPGTYLLKPDDFDSDMITAVHTWRSSAKRRWDKMNEVMDYYLGFGWYLQ